MRRFLFSLLLLPTCLAGGEARAVSMQHAEGTLVKCAVTPSVAAKVAHHPGDAVNITNNLRRATGSVYMAEGERLIIRGRVLDEGCFPIAAARVEIWHADASGRYKFPAGDAGADPYFLGSGVAETDNLGYYEFLTVMPGREGGAGAQFINVRVTRAHFPPLDTRLYFADMAGNADDPALANLIQEQRPLLEAQPLIDENAKGRAYLFNIVLSGKLPYRRY